MGPNTLHQQLLWVGWQHFKVCEQGQSMMGEAKQQDTLARNMKMIHKYAVLEN
jgi:hypothetical protein